MDEEDLHYLGGVIDSDGCVSVEVVQADYYRFDFSFKPKLRITGGAHDKFKPRHEILDEICRELNANRNEWTETVETGQGLSEYRYSSVKGKPAHTLFKRIVPYIREKRSDVQHLLSLRWPFLTGTSDWKRRSYLDAVNALEHIRETNGKSSTIEYTIEDLREKAKMKTKNPATNW